MIPVPPTWGVFAILGIVSLLLVPATPGVDDYDVTVSARVEWHPHLRYWELDEPTVESQSSSRLVNPSAWFTNTLVFASSDSKTVRFTLTQDGGDATTQEDETGKADGLSRLDGYEGLPRVVFRKVPAGEYTLRVQILDTDGSTLAESARTITVGGT